VGFAWLIPSKHTWAIAMPSAAVMLLAPEIGVGSNPRYDLDLRLVANRLKTKTSSNFAYGSIGKAWRFS